MNEQNVSSHYDRKTQKQYKETEGGKRRKISSCENQNNKLHLVLDSTRCISFPFTFDIGSLA